MHTIHAIVRHHPGYSGEVHTAAGHCLGRGAGAEKTLCRNAAHGAHVCAGRSAAASLLGNAGARMAYKRSPAILQDHALATAANKQSDSTSAELSHQPA